LADAMAKDATPPATPAAAAPPAVSIAASLSGKRKRVFFQETPGGPMTPLN
jgi:hypothetical protein